MDLERQQADKIRQEAMNGADGNNNLAIMYRHLSSAQVRLVMSGLAGPDTSVFRESCSEGEPSFFHVKAFSQMR